METEINTILGGKVRVRQFVRGVKVSSDAVLLASGIDDAVACKYRDVLDVGCGGGGIFLCLLYRFRWLNIVGLDLQEEMLDLAKQSVVLNDVENQVRLVRDDIFSLKSDIRDKQGLDLCEWIAGCVRRLRGHGMFAMIHKAERLDDILYACKKNSIGAVEVFPITSHYGEVANRVIVRGVKLSRTPAKLYPPIVLHGRDGAYTDIAEMLLSEGRSLPDVVRLQGMEK